MKYTILLDTTLFRHYTFHANSENSREGAELVSGIVRVCRKLTSNSHLTECSTRQLSDNDTFKFTAPGSTSRYTATKIYFSTIEQLQEQIKQLLDAHPSATQLHLLLLCVPRTLNAENIIFVGFTNKKKAKLPTLPFKLDSIPETIDYWFKTKVSLQKLEEYLFHVYNKQSIRYIQGEGYNFSVRFGEEIEFFCESRSYSGAEVINLDRIVITQSEKEYTLIKQNVVFHSGSAVTDKMSSPVKNIIQRACSEFS